MTTDEFLALSNEDIRLINAWSVGGSDYIPYRPGFLNENKLRILASSQPQYPFAVTKWIGSVDAGGSSVVIRTEGNINENTRKRKQQLIDRTYRLLYTTIKWSQIQKKVIEMLALEGNAIIRFDDVNRQFVVESRFRYNIYKNDSNEVTRYARLDNYGNEVKELKNLKHGENLWHIRLPGFSSWPIAPSPFDIIHIYNILENHGLVANERLFSGGMIGTILLKFEKEILPKLQDEKRDKEGKNWFERLMDKFNDSFAGSKKANRLAYIPGLSGVEQLGKDNKSTQFFELLKEITPERFAWAFYLTSIDFGTGRSTTYNNASTFDDALYAKFGKFVEEELDICRNDWILPFFGLKTNESYYIQYNKPENPKKLEEAKLWLEEYKNNSITLNELREKRGYPPLPDGEKLFNEIIQKVAIDQTNVTDITTNNLSLRGTGQGFFVKGVEIATKKSTLDFSGAKKTPTEKALASSNYKGEKGILTKFEKAIKKQLEDLAKKLEKLENPEIIELKKLETFYSFPSLKKDLLNFANLALDEVKKDKRTNFSLRKDFFDGEYPKQVLDYIDLATASILKGDDSQDYLFPSVDVETNSQIANLIKENITKPVAELTDLLIDKIPTIAKNRAELIASTIVAEATEKTREIMYLAEPSFAEGTKEWSTAVYDVCSICKGNESQGQIPIKNKFRSGHTSPTAHSRCGCTILYYPE